MTDREKLVELLAQCCEVERKGCVGCKTNYPGAAECKQEKFGWIADHLIANGVTVQEWISVKDRLPDEGASVNVYCIGGYVMQALWRDRLWRNIYGCYLWANVTHWMPLPKPSKEE